MLAVAGDDMRELPKVTPLQFLLSEGAPYITSYKISEKPLPEAMSVVFVIPRSREATGGAFFDGVLRCLRMETPQRPVEHRALYRDRRRRTAAAARSGTGSLHQQFRFASGHAARYPEAAGLHRPVDRSLVRHQTRWRPSRAANATSSF